MDASPDGGKTTPDRAFELLSDETRLEILRTLWASEEPVLAFSEIRDRLGRPDSGQFNYHLGELTDHFVRQTDGGYRLTQAGREVMRAVQAGSFTDHPARDGIEVDGECLECGGRLEASYEEHARIECTACDRTVMWNEFPPAGLGGRTPAEFLRAFDRWTQRRFRLARDGVCPSCAGRTTMEPVSAAALADEASPAPTYRCTNCKYRATIPLFGHVIDHPAVVAFFYDHGVDLPALPFWDLREHGQRFTHEVVRPDPLTIDLEIALDEDALSLRLDETLAVQSTRLSPH